MYNDRMAFASRGGSQAADPVAAIERGEIDPIYCLHGTERYLLDRCLTAIRAAVPGPSAAAFASFNQDIVELREMDVAAVVGLARTLPMMAPRRLVIAKGLDAIKADALAPLLPYAEDPSPTTCLVLVAAEKLDTRFKAFQVLRKAGYLHEFAPLRDRDLAAWITREARARKVAISADATAALAETVGSDLGRLSHTLEQLALFVGGGRPIALEDVEALVAETRQRSVFELTKAIGDGDVTRVLGILTNMLRNREPPLRIQFMLARQLRQIWRAKELLAQGAARDQIASATGVPPFFVDDVIGPARRMSSQALARGFDRLFDADRALKSSKVPPDLVVARLVQSLAEDARGADGRRSGRANPGG